MKRSTSVCVTALTTVLTWVALAWATSDGPNLDSLAEGLSPSHALAPAPAGPNASQASFADCNANGVDDASDIATGTSEDCNFNDTPDECEPDCNSNGTADECDIPPLHTCCNHFSTYCNDDDIRACVCAQDPWCCQLDWDFECDSLVESLGCGTCGNPDGSDCNANGTPDECELAGNDCNNNGRPDECDFLPTEHNCCETDHGWGCSDFDIMDCVCSLDSYCCFTDWDARCVAHVTDFGCDACVGDNADCNANGTLDECEPDCNNNLTVDDCDVPQNNCCEFGHGAGCSDAAIQACVCAFDSYCCSGNWDNVCVGEVENLNCGSCDFNSVDCNDNGTPDECEPDCNGNGVPDACDIAAGASQDCDADGIPNECESDCDGNAIPDDCEIISGAPDCNANAVPDGCELAGNDCNVNGRLDECDVAMPAHDCCATGHGTGCSDGSIAACVCASDPYCCNVDWDGICAGEVLSLGCGSCAPSSADCNDDGAPDECDTGCFTNNSFESGDFSGWITQDLSSPLFPLQVGPAGVNLGFGFFTSAPTHGSYAVLHGWDGNGPGTIRVAQDILIPIGTAAIAFDYRAGWDKSTYADPTQARTFRVLIGPAGTAGVWQNDLILTADPETINPDTGNLTGSVSVTDFVDSPARATFEWFVPEGFTGPAFFQLDNVRCVPSCIPLATVVGAVSRKANPVGSGGACDLPLIPAVKTDPRQGGVSELGIAFDVPPGEPGPNPVTILEATCAATRFEPYTGASTASAVVVGNELVVTFTPPLENARKYRIFVGSEVTSLPGQSVYVRGLVGDVNSDGFVNATDRSVVVGVWTSPSHFSCGTDLNSNGVTNATDRSLVVGAWTGTQNCAP